MLLLLLGDPLVEPGLEFFLPGLQQPGFPGQVLFLVRELASLIVQRLLLARAGGMARLELASRLILQCLRGRGLLLLRVPGCPLFLEIGSQAVQLLALRVQRVFSLLHILPGSGEGILV